MKIVIPIVALSALLFAVVVAMPSRTVVVVPPVIEPAPSGATSTLSALALASTVSEQVSSAARAVVSAMLPHTVPAETQRPFDATQYNAKLLALANLPSPRIIWTGTSTARTSSTVLSPLAKLWPVSAAAYPNPGALLPFNRIVAYYGNLYSKQMGILGELPPDEMLARLQSTTAIWATADPSTPAIPALQYIVVTAQASKGPDGKYRLRMPDDQIEKVLRMADSIHAIVFLDVQVGLSNVQTEVPLLEPYLKLPQVHLALDPEFSMKDGAAPGTEIGTMNADDVNFAAQYLAKLVQDNDIPPKILVVHRFTQAMLKRYKEISPLPEVQIVMDMDGFGSASKKIGTYQAFIQPEPVQFTGIKLFYKNDARADHLMTPAEVLRLTPQPSYVQYQ